MSEDLVEKMLELLTPEQKQELAASLLKEDKPKEVKPTKNATVADDFTMSQDKPSRLYSLEVKQRVNLFSDDGTEHKDTLNETPEVTPTERKRQPVKKIPQTCSGCSSVVQVHPTHKRENFICDKCLGSRSR
jgi:hypothetical protein